MLYNNEQYAKQLISFDNMKYGKIYPSDVDAFIEYRDKLYILIELKYKNATLPIGQKLMIERLIDRLNETDCLAVAFVCSHETKYDTNIDLASCKIEKIRWNKKWINDTHFKNIKEGVDYLINYIDKKDN